MWRLLFGKLKAYIVSPNVFLYYRNKSQNLSCVHLWAYINIYPRLRHYDWGCATFDPYTTAHETGQHTYLHLHTLITLISKSKSYRPSITNSQHMADWVKTCTSSTDHFSKNISKQNKPTYPKKRLITRHQEAYKDSKYVLCGNSSK